MVIGHAEGDGNCGLHSLKELKIIPEDTNFAVFRPSLLAFIDSNAAALSGLGFSIDLARRPLTASHNAWLDGTTLLCAAIFANKNLEIWNLKFENPMQLLQTLRRVFIGFSTIPWGATKFPTPERTIFHQF